MNNDKYVVGFNRRERPQATTQNIDEIIELSSEDDSNLPPLSSQQQQQPEQPQQPEPNYNNQSMLSYAENDHQIKTEIMHESVHHETIPFDIYQGDGIGDKSIPEYEYEATSDGDEFISDLKARYQYPSAQMDMPGTSDLPATTDYAATSPMVTSTTAPVAAASAAPSPSLLQNPLYSAQAMHSEFVQNLSNNFSFDEFSANSGLGTSQLEKMIETRVHACMQMTMKKLTEQFDLVPKNQTPATKPHDESESKQKRKYQHVQQASRESKNANSRHNLRPPKKEKYRRYSSSSSYEDDLYGPSTSVPKYAGNFCLNLHLFKNFFWIFKKKKGFFLIQKIYIENHSWKKGKAQWWHWHQKCRTNSKQQQ